MSHNKYFCKPLARMDTALCLTAEWFSGLIRVQLESLTC